MPDGMLTSIATGAGGSIQNLSFGFDGLGNLRSRTLSGVAETFDYDILNRLTHRNAGVIASYAPNGNILSKVAVDGNAVSSMSYDTARPHALVGASYNSQALAQGYDANGNVSSRTFGGGSWNFRYAGFDKPRWMARTVGGTTTGSEFLYNANRSRTVQLEFDQFTTEPSHYVRKRIYAMDPTLELNYNNTAPSGATWALDKVRIYVPSPEGAVGAREWDIAVTPGGGEEKALVNHYDHLGSIESITPFGSTAVSLATDESGLPSRFAYDPWGQRRLPTALTGVPTITDNGVPDSLTPRGFTGHEMLDDLGLVHMNGRVHDPLLGRLLSADLLVVEAGDLQSYNRYSYVRNRPLSAIDPSGFADLSMPLQPFPIIDKKIEKGVSFTEAAKQTGEYVVNSFTEPITEPAELVKAGLTEWHLTPGQRVQFTVFGTITLGAAIIEGGIDLLSGGSAKGAKGAARQVLREGGESLVSEVVEKEAKNLAGDTTKRLDAVDIDAKKLEVDSRTPANEQRVVRGHACLDHNAQVADRAAGPLVACTRSNGLPRPPE